jgi:hypothetical protein
METHTLRKLSLALILASLLCGCSTAGTLGIITKSTVDPTSVLGSGQKFQELGPAEGTGCRHFFLAIIPFGAADLANAVDFALQKTQGDALINVVTHSSLYTFIPYLNLYSFTCTTVKGTAIKFESTSHPLTGSLKEPNVQ